MNSHQRILIASSFLSSLFLSGCMQSATSAERHARHFVHVADHSPGPDFYINKTDSARIAAPFFEQFWKQGKNDREMGITPEEAHQRVRYFTSDEFLNSVNRKTHFAGREYINSDTTSKK